MPSNVEIADRASRKRAIGVAVAAIVFLVIQIVARPVFNPSPETAHLSKIVMWAINAAALLFLLMTGGGLAQRKEIRELIHDEVARSNSRSAVVFGYWIAMAAAMAVYLIAGRTPMDAREAVYVIVTPSIGLALLAFSWLEYRAHSDA
ncbi:MAG TPA: hypothetical protein VJL35_00250 [Gemmatimonadaceae bacterium]|jgi:hypothetical protein|nr:hypothetical protein [Gemmatimonadaceae bacterium]